MLDGPGVKPGQMLVDSQLAACLDSQLVASLMEKP